MTKLNQIETLSNYILENCQVTTLKDSISLDGAAINGNNRVRTFLSLFTREILLNLGLSDVAVMEETRLRNYFVDTSPNVVATINNTIVNKMREAYNENVVLQDVNVDFTQLVPVVDENTKGGDYFLVDADEFHYSDITHGAWSKLVAPEFRKIAEQRKLSGTLKYLPHSGETISIVEDVVGERRQFNKYISPRWKIKPDPTIKLDPRFIKFLETLVTTKECLQYLINWSYSSCFQKLEPYMLMRADGGVGKELFSKAIEQLAGPSNFTKVSTSVLERGNKFNGHLLHKTICFYDECNFSAQEAKNKLKDWANSKAPIELKGVDQKTEDNFASCLIATNNISDCHIEPNDRKFSVMDMTSETMDARLGRADRIFCWDYVIKDKNFAQAFYNYLEENRTKDFKATEPYHGPTYKDLIFSTLRDWQVTIVDRITSKEKYYYFIKDIKNDIEIKSLGKKKIVDFLDNFRPDNDEKLGSVVIYEGITAIKPSDKYLPLTDDLD